MSRLCINFESHVMFSVIDLVWGVFSVCSIIMSIICLFLSNVRCLCRNCLQSLSSIWLRRRSVILSLLNVSVNTLLTGVVIPVIAGVSWKW